MSLSSSKQKKAATLWRQRVRELFSNRDAITGQKEPANPTELTMYHCHHIIPKKMGGNPHVAYKIINGILLSRENHARAHSDPDWLMMQIERRFPAWHRLLFDLKRKTGRYTNEDLDADIRALEELEV